MTDDGPLSADRVPTLTEVVELDLPAVPVAHAADLIEAAREGDDRPVFPGLHDPGQTDAAGASALAEVGDAHATPASDGEPSAEAVWVAAVDSDAGSLDPRVALPGADAVGDVDAIVGQVLAELMPRIDMLLESRLREALAPALARAADGLIRDTRSDLAVAMRDLAQEAVDRVVQRRAER